MSREFGDNLTKDDVKTIADVRRDVWTSGFKGMGYGSAGGYILHTITRVIHRNLSEAARGKLILPGSDKPIRFNRNTAFFSVMAGSALGSFLMATTTGKNEVHQLHSIFEIGKNEYKTPYQKFYEEGKTKVEESEEAREKRGESEMLGIVGTAHRPRAQVAVCLRAFTAGEIGRAHV